MLDLIILLVLTGLVALAFFVHSPLLRFAVVFAILIVLIGRELSIDAYVRSLATHKGEAGLWTEDYKNGALAMVDYCKATRFYVFVTSGLLIILCARGFWDSKRKKKDKAL